MAIFSIKANTEVKVLTISKEKLLDIVSFNDNIHQQLKINAFKTYKETTKVLMSHNKVLLQEVKDNLLKTRDRKVSEKEIQAMFREKLINVINQDGDE